MNDKQEIIQRLTDPGIIAVVRARRRDQVLPLAEALVKGGVIAVEITMTTPDAIAAIAEASGCLGDRALIGVGTVLDKSTCQRAVDAGAKFVVSPITRTELVEVAHAAGCPVMLGAYTPTEAQTAYEAGSDFIKIFPADGLGPQYIRGIRAPLPHLRIVPTGGVNLDTAVDFLKAGCAALGVGSSLVSARILERNDWDELEQLAGRYVGLVRAFRAT